MLTYEYKLYNSKRNRKLDAMLREACFVWNHALALQKRYYSLYEKYCSVIDMQKHFAKRISRHLLYSQSVQEILQRQDAAYKRFFNHLAKRPPKFKRASEFSSIVWKQGGYKLNSNVFVVNSIRQHFQFSFSRPYVGKVKTVRIKRSHLGEYYLYIVTDAEPKPYGKTHDGASVGMDFGLKTYLTLYDGELFEKRNCPQYLKRSLKDLRKAYRAWSKAEVKWSFLGEHGEPVRGSRVIWQSNHRKARRLDVERAHERVANRRDNWQWKLAHELCRRYDIIYIEDLCLKGMTRLWGRKMSDLAHGRFLEKLEHVAGKYGCRIIRIAWNYPSSKTCNVCQYVKDHLSLNERDWVCPSCGTHHDRDVNAAINILRQGIASSGSPCETRLAEQGALATGEFH